MKRLFILFISIVVFMPVAYNQNSYLIEYDKPTDKFTYKSKTLAGKKQEEKVIKNLPKLQEGDVVTVHVKNYNPFLYYVDITSSELIEESSSSADNSGAMSMLNMITGGLNPISSFLGTLSDVEGMFNSRGDGAAMGEEEYDEPEVMHPDEFAHFETNQGIISELIKDYNTKYENYLNLKSQVYEENLHQNVEGLIEQLEKKVLATFSNPTQQINELYSSGKLHALKSGMKDHNIRESVRKFDKEVNNFKRLAEDSRNDYNKEDITMLIQTLKEAKFETKQSFEISTDETRSFTIDEGSVLTGMVYQINFYDVQEVGEMTRNEVSDNSLNYVSYYYLDRFWSPEGEVVDEPCEACIPVLRAEGLYDGNAPRYFEDFYDDMKERLPEDASGKWLFYDRDGELSRIDMEPHVRSNQAEQRNDKEDYSWLDLDETITEKRNVTVPVKGAVVMSWSTGIYGVSSFQGRNEYSATYNETFDTLTVGSSSLDNFRMCFGSQMVFDFRGNKIFSPSFNLGAAIDLWDDRDIHFLAGMGIKFNSFPLLSLTGGISFTRMNQLNDDYEVGESYDYTGFEELSRKSFGIGYYVGININF